jgi:hypothetical protein
MTGERADATSRREFLALTGAALALGLGVFARPRPGGGDEMAAARDPNAPEKLEKSDAEWQKLYRRHLAEDGLLAVHISNKFLAFEPVVRRVGEAAGLHAIHIVSDYDFEMGATSAEWTLLAAKPETLAPLAAKGRPPAAPPAENALWTDDYANVMAILH